MAADWLDGARQASITSSVEGRRDLISSTASSAGSGNCKVTEMDVEDGQRDMLRSKLAGTRGA